MGKKKRTKKGKRENKYRKKLNKLKNSFYRFFFFPMLILVSCYLIFSFKEAPDILEQIKIPDLLNNFGFLGLLCIPPLLYSGYWALKVKSSKLRKSVIWGVLVIPINSIFALCNTYEFLSLQIFNPKCEDYLPPILILLLSIFYGIICVNSCYIGLGIEKKNPNDNKFSFFSFMSVSVSIAVILYLFILEKLEQPAKERLPYVTLLLLSFVFLAISISFLYVIMGYYSQNENGNPNSILLVISITFSFSIGTMLSILVLQYGRAAEILIYHWTFLYIWTIFINSLPTLIEEKTGFSEIIQDFSSFLFGFN